MPFVGFTGLPRSGKTFAVTFFSILLAGEDGRIVGNFPIVHRCFEEITPYDLVGFLKRGRVSEAVTIATQEVYGWLDSYIAMSKVNRFESYFVFQASKMNYNWVWDSQRNMKVDSSLRDMTPFRFDCKRKGGFFRYELMDRRYPNDNVGTGKCLRIPFRLARRFWDRYDTHKGGIPLGYDEMLTEMERLVPELMNKTIDSQVKVLWEKRDEFGFGSYKGISRVGVEDALLRLGLPVAFAAYVANRLKLLCMRKSMPQR